MSRYVEDRQSYTNGLRQLADFLDANPEFVSNFGFNASTTFYADDTNFKKLVKLLPGKRDKEMSDYSLTVSCDLGDHTIDVWTDRSNVCEKKLVGTHTVKKEVPVTEATKTIEVEEEIYEWDCVAILD